MVQSHLSVSGQCIVWGNAELLHSAIENVVRNAIRYTESGTVPSRFAWSVIPHRAERVFALLVRDYGPGVPEPELKNIFQPFYRVDRCPRSPVWRHRALVWPSPTVSSGSTEARFVPKTLRLAG